MVGAEVGDAVGEGDRALLELVGGPGVVDHADLLGFLAGDVVARVVELLRLPHAEDEREDGAVAGDAETAHAGVPDADVLGGGDHVGHHRHLTAAGEGVAVQLGDRDLGHVPVVHLDVGDLLHAGAHVPEQAAALVVDGAVAADDSVGPASLGRGEVVAGAEAASGALDDDDADAVVGLVVVKGLVELEEKLLGERVHLLGAVEGDASDASVGAGAVEEEVFVLGHGCTPGG